MGRLTVIYAIALVVRLSRSVRVLTPTTYTIALVVCLLLSLTFDPALAWAPLFYSRHGGQA